MASRREERHKINRAVKSMRNGLQLCRFRASSRRVFSFFCGQNVSAVSLGQKENFGGGFDLFWMYNKMASNSDSMTVLCF